MEESLLESAAFVALPVFVILSTQIDDVFAGNVGWATGRRKHLALHHRLDLAGNLYQKLFPDAAWFCMLVCGFEQISSGFPVDPFSD